MTALHPVASPASGCGLDTPDVRMAVAHSADGPAPAVDFTGASVRLRPADLRDRLAEISRDGMRRSGSLRRVLEPAKSQRPWTTSAARLIATS